MSLFMTDRPSPVPAPDHWPPTWQDKLEIAILRGFRFFLNRLGIDRASALMGFLWRYLAPFNKRHARAERHLKLAMPELTRDERRVILGNMWENLGRTAAETMLLPRLGRETHRIMSRYDTRHRPASAEKGAVMVSLHLGNWELPGVVMRDMGYTLNAIYKPLRNPLAEELLIDNRRDVYAGSIFPREAGIGVKMRNMVRGGQAIAVMADLYDDNGLVLDFFGRPARTTMFPALISRRMNEPLFIGKVVRRHGAYFEFDGFWVDVPHTDDPEGDIIATTKIINATIENWIRENPDQWMWAHKKWLASK